MVAISARRAIGSGNSNTPGAFFNTQPKRRSEAMRQIFSAIQFMESGTIRFCRRHVQVWCEVLLSGFLNSKNDLNLLGPTAQEAA
jgi:hypothetical protein